MDTDSEGDLAGSHRGGGADRISGLPGELLDSILLRLPGTADAARTSVLARRWRRVWAQLPELSLTLSEAQGHGAVDAALAAYSAPTVRRLEINTRGSVDVPVDRVSSWLRFASQHLEGELRLRLQFTLNKLLAIPRPETEEVVLPLCDRATAIDLTLCCQTLRFQLPPDGVFSALATLSIGWICVDGPELEDVLRSRCPRLKQLVLDTITLQGGAHIPSISIRSHSLERLTITAPSQLQGCFEIDTPELQAFCPRNVSGFYIAAPKLLEVDWSINYFYYSSRQCFAENGRYLQWLVVSANYPGFLMMQRFETVKELELCLHQRGGVQEYMRFLEVTNKVAKCEVLVVKIMKVEHAYWPMLLHLLGKCPELRKVVVQFGSHKDDYPCESYSGCPCSWLENRKTNYLVLDSLEQVAIEDPDDYGNAADKVDLVRLFGKISARCEKRVSITVSERCKATREKISSICPPNDKVEILVRST